MQVSSWIAARVAVLVEFAVFLISSTIISNADKDEQQPLSAFLLAVRGESNSERGAELSKARERLCSAQRARRHKLPRPHFFYASLPCAALGTQQRIHQLVVLHGRRAQRQAARLEEVAARKLPGAERVVLAVV